jgi:glycosyltransferase involved in cell wall biosynthesis
MKILILTNKLPYPPKDGGSIATLNMLSGLRDAGNELSCLALNTSKHSFPVEDIPPEIGQSIRFMGVDCDNSIKPLRLLLNLLFSRKPYIAERFNVHSYREQLCALLDKENFDVVQLEGPYLGHYLADIRKRTSALISLRAHNVEHLIWKKKAENEKSPLKKGYLRNMASRLESYELKVAREVDCLVPISQGDADYFKSRASDQAMLTTPTGLSLKDYPLTPLPSETSMFFIGALDWLPNQEGLLWFLDQVFDRVYEKVPGLRFHVAGRNAPRQFEKRLSHPGITYHGEVSDARAFMQTYRVMVVPLLTGSGIRIKILEGMALGRPVVTTQVGMDGIPAENAQSVFVNDDPYKFANQLINLLEEKNDLSRILAASRDLITQNFDTFGLSTRLSQYFKAQV